MAFILIVDANRIHAVRASDVLTAAGHTCGCVVSAEQAVALLRWRVPELILLDQEVAGADGGTLPHKLRRVAGGDDLPIILLSTDSTAALRADGGTAVLDDIRKPFDPGFLAWRVGHALEAHAAARTQLAAVEDVAKRALRSLA